jgi:ribosome-binding protein aMBF1 (putative translation factor)
MRPRYAQRMGKKTADDVARELLSTTASEREAHAAAVQALLARNEALLTNDEMIARDLRDQADFQAEWHRTAAARAVAIALVRYRADHGLSRRELAKRLRMTPADVSTLELGDVNPSTETLNRVADELGIELTVDVESPPRVE